MREAMGALSESFLLHLPAHFYSLPQSPIMLVLGWAPTPREKLAPQTPRTEHLTRLSAFDCLVWVRPNPMKSKAQLSLQDVLMRLCLVPLLLGLLPPAFSLFSYKNPNNIVKKLIVSISLFFFFV